MPDLVLILPPGQVPGQTHTMMQTPYGDVIGSESPAGLPILVRREGGDARALIYTAKELGARRILAGEVVQPISPLLEPGDLVVPADVIDQTKLRPSTFFVEKGYGFIKLNPPFCPDLMATCLSITRASNPRTFRGATYLGIEWPREATEAEARMFRQWGVDVVGSELLPEAYLARELELCYAALVAVGEGDLLPLLEAVARGPHGQRPCTCGESMKLMKEQGVVGEDWRQW